MCCRALVSVVRNKMLVYSSLYELAGLFIIGGQIAVCLCVCPYMVCMLTRVTQIVGAAHSDL